jgi:muconolactone delta-isomerase
MPVNTPRDEYDKTTERWRRMRDTYAGRDAIIKGGTLYTPTLPAATPDAQHAYLHRGNFYNAVRRTVSELTGGIFQKTPRFDVPRRVQPWLSDVTLTNIPMGAFALAATEEVMLMARYGILVEMADSPYLEPRPYFVSYTAENIVNWESRTLDGDEILTLVVLQERHRIVDEADAFRYKTLEQYRELRLHQESGALRYTQQVWRRPAEGGDLEKVGAEITPLRRGAPLPFIPFTFLGPAFTTPEIKDPPLLDLANISLAHWRNSCDHEQGLHLVSLPTPYVSGMRGASEDVAALQIGPSTVWILEKDGRAGMVEFSGAGMGALETALLAKQHQMATLGAKLLEEQPTVAQETATAVLARHAGEHATLRTMAQAMEQGLRAALQTMSWWDGLDAKPLDVPVKVELNKDFLQVKAQPQEVATALAMLQAGEISYKTFWNILTEGGWARYGITDVEEKDEINREPEQLPPPTEEVIEVEEDA